MAGKDPAFLFYSLDWLQGTASLMPDEKGVYIDLLCHQHRDGSLPADTKRLARMVGLPLAEFETIWSNLKSKFMQPQGDHMVDRLVNQKLHQIMTKRATTSRTKTIAGTFAVLIRSANGVPEEIKAKIKSEFLVSDYEGLKLEEATKRITIWFTKRLSELQQRGDHATIENETPIRDSIDDDKEGMGEKEEGKKGMGGQPPDEGSVVYDVETELLNNRIRFEKICIATQKTEAVARDSLHKYHLHLQEKEGYPKSKKALFAGFEKWLLNEKNFKNGSTQQSGRSGKNPGLYQAIDYFDQELAARGYPNPEG